MFVAVVYFFFSICHITDILTEVEIVLLVGLMLGNYTTVMQDHCLLWSAAATLLFKEKEKKVLKEKCSDS